MKEIKKNHNTRNIPLLLAAIFPLFIVVILREKIIFIEEVFGGGGCYGCFLYPVLRQDAIIFSLFLVLYWCSCYARAFLLRAVLRLISVIISLIYILDFFVLKNFFTRLSIDDFFKYGKYAPGFILNTVQNIFSFKEYFLTVFILIIFVCSGWSFIVHSGIKQKIYGRILAGLAILLSGIYFLPENQSYAASWVYENVFEYNSNKGANVHHSSAFKQNIRLKEKQLNKEYCQSKTSFKKNIVVVVAEGLSMYHSQYFSGLSNLTPHLDRIAKENISFLNFYANGYTTEQGLISLLMGKIPIPFVHQNIYSESFAFEGFHDENNSLPGRLRDRDYSSEFLTTGDLTFSNKRKWLENIGFDYIEGHEHEDYKGWRRYHFSAAPDEALYHRAVDRIFNVKHDKPYFMMLETVSTHHPFIDPIRNKRSESGAFIYADKQLGDFYDYLKNNNFFDSGILIIVSDHRTMTPIKKEEIQLYGEKAPARIPFVVCMGNSTVGIVNMPFQQIDLYSSIINFVSEKSCTSRWKGDFLDQPRVPPDFIFHVSGNDRDIIRVFYDKEGGRIKLNGDKTSFIDGNIPEATLVIDKINYERLYEE